MPRSLQPDRKLFGVTLALCLIGAVMVFSASAITAREQGGNGYTFLLRQLVWIALGLAGMFRLMHTDYRKFRQPRVIFTAVSITLVMLISVFFLDRSHATHRWFRLGPLSLQPSEIAKLVLIFYLAWFIEIRRGPKSFGINDPVHTLLPALGTVLLMVGLVLGEPDMGTACMILLIAAVMLYVSGLSMRYIVGAVLAAIPVVYLLIESTPYRLERFKAFLSPSTDPQGHGFQLLQSLIAIGSGGFTGGGLVEGRRKLFFLPESHTDFIFAVICEELGFIGAAIVLTLFFVYGSSRFVGAIIAPDEVSRLLALAMSAMVIGLALVNLSVVLGLMPTKGIPLQFISYAA